MSQHHHNHGHDQQRRHHDKRDNEHRVFWAMVLIGSFMLVEVVGGLVSGSLALLADAGHMLTDFAALMLAWFGFRISRKPPDAIRSYGYYRFEVLAAFVNGITLFLMVAWIFYEAIQRLFEPIEILGGLMMGVAAVGLVINIVAFVILHGGDRSNLNIRGAATHVLGDLFGSVATIGAAAIILWTGWTPIDPLLSFLVGLLILKSAWRIVAESAHILLEGTPQDMDVDKLSSDLQDTITEVQEVHHVHAWSLTPRRSLMTLHVKVDRDSDQDSILAKINAFLLQHWRVRHSTIQVERTHCPDSEEEKDRAC